MDESRKRHFPSLPLLVLAGIAEALCPHCTEDVEFRNWHTPIHSGAGHRLMICTQALADLALTCQSLYAIVNPVLYYQLQGYSEGRVSHLRRLAKRPKLARRVKVLRLDFDGGLEALKTEEDLALALTIAARLGWPISLPNAARRHPRSARIERMDDDFLTSLMIALCPNLEKRMHDGLITSLMIALCPNTEKLSTSCGDFYDFGLPRPATLPRLKNIYITHADTEMGTGLQHLMRLFLAAPNMETFTSNMTSSVGTVTLPMANVRHLRLGWSCISSRSLRTLLRSCPQLESFVYQAGGALVGDEQFDSESLRTLLLRYVPRLKHLELYFVQDCGMREWDKWDDGGDDGGRSPEPAPGFSSLTHLETLTIDAALLDDWDGQQSVATLFPQSLRSLTVLSVYSDAGPRKDEFEAFAATARNLLPNLTAFEIRQGSR